MPATIGTETTREGLFASTRWTMVIDAAESQSPPDQALSALSGKDELFKQLNSHLSVSSEATVPYEEMSLRLGRPVTTLRSDVARLRSRYRAILREEVGGTVAEASEVDSELRHLCKVLAAD